MASGIVFDISHYMIEDGPGIRTNVFVKGCPLRCKWCSNAFGLEPFLQLSYQQEKCTGCGACLAVCPKGAVRISGQKALQDFTPCRTCEEFACISACPAAARKIVGKVMSAEEVIKEVLEDQIFYRRGGGGMTVSGGEILLQPAFVKELLGKGRDAYLHNAIETSGCGKWEDLKDMIDLTDVVFMDIKAVDPFLHKELTGVDNRVILENIKKAASYCQTTDRVFVLRLPLIPGCNDTEDNLKRTGQLACRLQTELNVLPYHNYGAAKYARIGKTYELSEVSRQSKEDLAKAGKILRQTGAEVTMGGYSVESY